MNKRVIWMSIVLIAMVILGSNDSLAADHKILEDALINRVRSYVWYDMEEMVCYFPNATIPYRGSDTINSLNNSVFCRGTESGVGIRKFVQTNNAFPIIWSTEFSIGMNYADLTEITDNWRDTSDVIIVNHIDYEDEQIILCHYDGGITDKDAFVLKFYVFNDHVYQIEFEFLTN